MSENNDYLLVKADVLPEVFVKVMEAKRLLNSGKAVSVNEAVKIAQSGDVVLLSPTTSSFDQYSGYEERGRHFKKIVNSL